MEGILSFRLAPIVSLEYPTVAGISDYCLIGTRVISSDSIKLESDCLVPTIDQERARDEVPAFESPVITIQRIPDDCFDLGGKQVCKACSLIRPRNDTLGSRHGCTLLYSHPYLVQENHVGDSGTSIMSRSNSRLHGLGSIGRVRATPAKTPPLEGVA